jgi:hypothetical protein
MRKRNYLNAIVTTAVTLTMLTASVYTQTVTVLASDSVTTAQSIPSGEGTETSPYQIGTASELFWFAAQVNNNSNTSICATLTNDIDLSGNQWTPIGTASVSYKGTFDGNGKTISNMLISAEPTKLGLFGSIESATIKNLTVKGEINIQYSQNYSSSQTDCTNRNDVGGIVGQALDSTLDGLTSYVNITNTANNSNQMSVVRHVGGILGAGTIGSSSSSYMIVNNCKNYGDLTISNSNDCVGGVIGYVGGNSASPNPIQITGCANEGKLKVSKLSGGKGLYGGILGYVNLSIVNLTLTNCYSVGIISTTDSDSSVGALIGKANSSGKNIILTNNYWYNFTSSVNYENATNAQRTLSGSVGESATKDEILASDGRIQRLLASECYKVTNGYIFIYGGNTVSGSESTITAAELPDTITSIDESAFSKSDKLVYIIIPKATEVGANAFEGCTALTTAYIYKDSSADEYFTSSDIKKYIVEDGSISIQLVDKSKKTFNFIIDMSKFGGNDETALFLEEADIIVGETNSQEINECTYSDDDNNKLLYQCKYTGTNSAPVIRGQVIARNHGDTDGTSSNTCYVTPQFTF